MGRTQGQRACSVPRKSTHSKYALTETQLGAACLPQVCTSVLITRICLLGFYILSLFPPTISFTAPLAEEA